MWKPNYKCEVSEFLKVFSIYVRVQNMFMCTCVCVCSCVCKYMCVCVYRAEYKLGCHSSGCYPHEGDSVELELQVWLWPAEVRVRKQPQTLSRNRASFDASLSSLHLIGFVLLLFCFWEWVSQLAWSQSNRLDCLASDSQGFPASTSPTLGLHELSSMSCFLLFLLGIKLKSSNLLGKHWLTKLASLQLLLKDFNTTVSKCSMDSMCVHTNFARVFMWLLTLDMFISYNLVIAQGRQL